MLHLRWLLVVLGVVLIIGHVCELPLGALFTAGYAEATEEDDHGDGFHDASCEAVIAADTVPTVTVQLATALPLSRPPRLSQTVGRDVPSTSAPLFPPLFLLHAALLI